MRTTTVCLAANMLNRAKGVAEMLAARGVLVNLPDEWCNNFFKKARKYVFTGYPANEKELLELARQQIKKTGKIYILHQPLYLQLPSADRTANIAYILAPYSKALNAAMSGEDAQKRGYIVADKSVDHYSQEDGLTYCFAADDGAYMPIGIPYKKIYSHFLEHGNFDTLSFNAFEEPSPHVQSIRTGLTEILTLCTAARYGAYKDRTKFNAQNIVIKEQAKVCFVPAYELFDIETEHQARCA